METAITDVSWNEDTRILTTRVAGVLTASQVQTWKDRLYQAGRLFPKEGPFKMLIDIQGYEVADQAREVHQVMREVTPVFLASHGFNVGFFSLYEVEPPVAREEASARCIAVAHVHHDADKMERYNELLGTDSERFFCDAGDAELWLTELAQEIG